MHYTYNEILRTQCQRRIDIIAYMLSKNDSYDEVHCINEFNKKMENELDKVDFFKEFLKHHHR